MSRQLEGADSHGDAAGRNSSSRVLRSSQCMYPSTKHPGKSPLSMEGGMNCKICESPGFRARRIKSPSFHENKIFGFSQSHKMPIRKGILPDIQTRLIGSYSPFLECQQGLLRNFSENISGMYRGKRLISNTHIAEHFLICVMVHYVLWKPSQPSTTNKQFARQ
jgi:hypothetical protein